MHYYLLIIIFFALLFDKLNIFFYLVVSSFMHETGHIVACILLGAKPHIELSVFGIKLSGYPDTKIKKLIVLTCGPLVNLALTAGSKLLLMKNFSLKIYVFMIVNIVVFLFNCLPVFFLDGGQIIELLCSNKISRRIFDFLSATIIFITIVEVSNNITVSLIMLALFIIYYFINKKTAFY